MGGTDWLELAKDTVRWRSLVNALGTVKCGEFLD